MGKAMRGMLDAVLESVEDIVQFDKKLHFDNKSKALNLKVRKPGVGSIVPFQYDLA